MAELIYQNILPINTLDNYFRRSTVTTWDTTNWSVFVAVRQPLCFCAFRITSADELGWGATSAGSRDFAAPTAAIPLREDSSVQCSPELCHYILMLGRNV